MYDIVQAASEHATSLTSRSDNSIKAKAAQAVINPPLCSMRLREVNK